MHPRIKHINELVRHANKTEITTLTRLLTKETPLPKRLEEKRDKKIEAIKYLENDEEIDINITPIDEDHSLSEIKLKEDGKTHLCADCKHMVFKGEKYDSKLFCKLKNELQEYYVESCEDYVKGEYQ